MKRGHRTAGLDQMGPSPYAARMVFTAFPAKRGNKWSVGSRAGASTKRRKVKVTLAAHA